MKKTYLIASAVVLVLGMAASASATSYYEEYSGYHKLTENNSNNFGFDMWYTNDVFGIGTDSSLSLTSDASGAFDPWSSATLSIDLYSVDWASETAEISLTAWDGSGNSGDVFDLGTYNFNGALFVTPTTKSFTFEFTEAQLTSFEELGWGNVTISAAATPWYNYNDFAITKVGLDVNAVPEPGTMMLMGAGILGLLGYNRKRFAKNS